MRASRIAVAAAAAIAAATVLTGCSGTGPSMTAGPTASAAPASGTSLAAADFAAAAKMPNTVLLDVRTPAEFASGHLPGAINLDVESADFAAGVAQLDPAKSYAVYCRSANRSKVAMSSMQAAGVTKVFDLSGGINSWKQSGGEVVTG